MKYLIIILILLSINPSFCAIRCEIHSTNDSYTAIVADPPDDTSADFQIIWNIFSFNIDTWDPSSSYYYGLFELQQSNKRRFIIYNGDPTPSIYLKYGFYTNAWNWYTDTTWTKQLALDTNYIMIQRLEYDVANDDLITKHWLIEEDGTITTHTNTHAVLSTVNSLFDTGYTIDIEHNFNIRYQANPLYLDCGELFVDWHYSQWGDSSTTDNGIELMKTIARSHGGTSLINANGITSYGSPVMITPAWAFSDNYTVVPGEENLKGSPPDYLFHMPPNPSYTNVGYVLSDSVYKRRRYKQHKTKIR